MSKLGTILLVENDINDAFLIRKAFTDVGVDHQFHVLTSGKQAFAYLNGETPFADRHVYPLPFLLLTDFKMPDGDAFAILRWLAERPNLKKEIVVIVLSSMCSKAQIDALHELGANSFLMKPVNYDELLAAVRQIKEKWIDTNVAPEAR